MATTGLGPRARKGGRSSRVLMVAGISLGVVIALLYAYSDPPVAGVMTPPAPAYEETGNTESWVENVVANGEGIVRVESTPDRHVVHTVFRNGAPLSIAGKQALRDHLASKAEIIRDRLNARGRPTDGESSLSDYAEDLRLIGDHEMFLILQEMLTSGTYLTLPLQPGEAPPLPPAVWTYQVGPVELADGQLGQALFVIDPEKRQATRDLRLALREVMSADREERLEKFNLQPLAERRRWVDRYSQFLERAQAHLTDLSPEEMREYMAMRREVDYLRASVDVDSAMLMRR